MRASDIAFPVNQSKRQDETAHSGLTKLEYAAIHILASMRSGKNTYDRQTTDDEMAIRAIEQAIVLCEKLQEVVNG